MVHPANEHLQYFLREAMKKEKEKNSGIEQRESRAAAQILFTRNNNPPESFMQKAVSGMSSLRLKPVRGLTGLLCVGSS
jgi:hypothetical protein